MLTSPFQRDTPRMAKIVKKKMASTMTPPSCATDDKSVEISTLILGIVVSDLRGLINLKVLTPETLFI